MTYSSPKCVVVTFDLEGAALCTSVEFKFSDPVYGDGDSSLE